MKIKEILQRQAQIRQVSQVIGRSENRVVLVAGSKEGGEIFRFNDPHWRSGRIQAFMEAYPKGSRISLYVYDKEGQELTGMEFCR
jgi:hypothetical protein